MHPQERLAALTAFTARARLSAGLRAAMAEASRERAAHARRLAEEATARLNNRSRTASDAALGDRG
ncbi:hypothetical protein [Actinoplanes sp. CA-252034]|uniref:hypothetical protein n=1 Tax=Actinoplanes sp. CA-252034 TaxID=3239906 RepID=UPI003D99C783